MAAKLEKLDSDEVEAIVRTVLDDCVAFVDGEMADDRARATRYYNGEPFGNEEDGRSKAVMTEVRDAISGMVPSAIRIFTGSDRAVEFKPTSAEKSKQVEQITDYVLSILRANGLFTVTYDVLMDAFIRRLGAVKWGYDETKKTKWYALKNVLESELEALTSEDTVTLGRVKETKKEVKPTYLPAPPAPPAQPGMPPQPPAPPAPPQLDPKAPPPAEAEYSVEFSRTVADGCFKFEAMPPEEFLFSRAARSRDNALCFAHRSYKTKSELVAMGVSMDDIEEYAGSDDTELADTVDERVRHEDLFGTGSGTHRDPEAGDGNDKVIWTEAYITLDVNGTGGAPVRKFLCLGPKFHVINGDGIGEPVNSVPMAWFTPYRTPHTIIGQSVADRTMDLQLTKSMVVRSMYDSLALAIFPRLGILENQVNQGDVLNTDIGSPIRMKVLNAIQPISQDFVGREALPILGFIDSTLERRTGQSNGATGLDADALQSTTEQGVGAQLSMAQQHIELIARGFAESILKPLMQGLYEMYIQYRPKAETVRLRGNWIEMDPRVWDADLDVVINVGLGTTDTTKKVAFLMGVHTEQSAIIQQYGMSNPVVGLPEYRNTLDDLCVLNGYEDASRWFKAIPDDYQPPQPQPDKPTPAEITANGELALTKAKQQAEMAMKESELQFEREKYQTDLQFKYIQLAQEATLRREATNAQFKSTTTEQQFEAERAQDQQAIDAHMAFADQQHSHAVDQHNQALAANQQQFEQSESADDQDHSQDIAQQGADSDAAAAAQPQGE